MTYLEKKSEGICTVEGCNDPAGETSCRCDHHAQKQREYSAKTRAKAGYRAKHRRAHRKWVREQTDAGMCGRCRVRPATRGTRCARCYKSKGRDNHRCGSCGRLGHYAPTCTDRTALEALPALRIEDFATARVSEGDRPLGTHQRRSRDGLCIRCGQAAVRVGETCPHCNCRKFNPRTVKPREVKHAA